MSHQAHSLKAISLNGMGVPGGVAPWPARGPPMAGHTAGIKIIHFLVFHRVFNCKSLTYLELSYSGGGTLNIVIETFRTFNSFGKTLRNDSTKLSKFKVP